jgi:hypothetical protein
LALLVAHPFLHAFVFDRQWSETVDADDLAEAALLVR